MATRPSERPVSELLDDIGRQGHCRFDPELHTGPDAFEFESRADKLAREDVAMDVCESCPVWESCLDFALRTKVKGGIWAGLRARDIERLTSYARTLGEAA
ncbi:WhiB family transcriptional regulator [Actinomadura sp. SCN-SB]|uniref:WhiB family transcriptional regulator n=1 Tax=Actinomadura sp. SCN-SB TaxID=3373092 RepID=UPI003752D061